MLLAHVPILGHVAAGLAHQPNRRIGNRLAPTRAHERSVAQVSGAGGARSSFSAGISRGGRICVRKSRRSINYASAAGCCTNGRCLALAREHRGCAIRRRLHQVPEFRMFRFNIDGDATPAQLFGTDRTNRSDHACGEAAPQTGAQALGLGHLHHVRHLVRAGEEDDICAACRDRLDRVAQRSAIFRQGPTINRDDGHGRAACFEARSEFTISDAVLLHRDALAGECEVRGERIEQFAPGIGLGNRNGRRNAEIAQCGDRLGAARNRDDPLQRRDDRRALDDASRSL